LAPADSFGGADFVTTVGDASSPPVLAYLEADETWSRVVSQQQFALSYGALWGIEIVGPSGVLLERDDPFGPCGGSQWLELRTLQRATPRWRYAFGSRCPSVPELDTSPRAAGIETATLRRATVSADGELIWAWVQRGDRRAELLLMRAADGEVLARDSSWAETRDIDLRLARIEGGGGEPGGFLAVAGHKRAEMDAAMPPIIRLLDPASLVVLDSVPPLVWSRSQQLWQLLPCHGSSVLLLAGSLEIVAYDFGARRPVASVSRPALGSAHAIAQCDIVAFASPPSSLREPVAPGVLWYFRDQLRTRDSIDLRLVLGRAREDPGPHVFGVSLSPDGRYLWARVGFDGGRLSGARELAELVVVRLADKRLVSRFPLGGTSWGPMLRAP
jgi:hypothetical protein